MNLFPQVPGNGCPSSSCWQRADLGSSAHWYRSEHSWPFFMIREISSAINGSFPDS
jgi:hypothetical protein